MKKHFLYLVCILFSLNAAGQTKDYYKDKRHEVRLSMGSVNDDYYQYFGYGRYSSWWGYGDNISDLGSYNRASYYHGAKKTMGVLSGSYFYHPSWINGRFSLGGSFSYSHFSEDIKLRLTDKKAGDVKEYNIAFTPSIRYAWIAKPIFQVYSGFGMSLYYNDYKYKYSARENFKPVEYTSNGLEASFQVTPIGFSVGKDIFGFGEINVGGRSGEFVGGVGYRF